jgi:hypothetical protein
MKNNDGGGHTAKPVKPRKSTFVPHVHRFSSCRAKYRAARGHAVGLGPPVRSNGPKLGFTAARWLLSKERGWIPTGGELPAGSVPPQGGRQNQRCHHRNQHDRLSQEIASDCHLSAPFVIGLVH